MSISIKIDYTRYFAIARDAIRNINIGHLLLIALVLHAIVMSQPADGFIFDEAHYVPAAIKTLNLEPANAEHTPLAKVVVAISIALLGDWWLAWRLPIVIMGTVCLYLTYLIALRFMQKKYALAAVALLIFDVMFFVHSTIFVLDVPAIMFGLLGIELYFRKKHFLSGASFGVSFLMKEIGLLMLGGIIVYHIAMHLRKKNLSINTTKAVAIFSAAMLIVSGGGLWIYDAVYHPMSNATVYQSVQHIVYVDQNNTPVATSTIISDITNITLITNPIEHLRFAVSYFTGLVPAIQTSDTDLRQPWTWVLPIGNTFNPPVYSAITITVGDTTMPIVRWVSQPSLFIEHLTFPLLAVSCIALVAKRKDEKTTEHAVLTLTWICLTFLPWMFLGIFVQRMTFNYYLIYTIPALTIGIPMMWSTIFKNEKIRDAVIFANIVLAVAFFFAYYPLILVR